jgi:hypothetical protein
MALLFMESFDHYATADLATKWSGTTVANATVPTIGAFGRRASNGCRFTGPFEDPAVKSYLTKAVTPSSGFVVGFSIKVSAAPTGSFGCAIVAMLDGATAQLAVRLRTDMTLALLRGSTTLATSTTTLAAGVEAYIEFSGLIHSSAGAATVRINSVSAATFSGNTQNSGSATWSTLALGMNAGSVGNGQGANYDVDDVYLLDQSGSAPWNTFLGDCRVDARYPTAAGATTGWTPSTGANWAAVDDAAPNGDTDYVSTVTVPATDTYVTQDAPVTGATIYGVQHCLSMKKLDAGACTIAPVIRHSGVDYPGANLSPGTAYAYGLQIASLNPGTGAAWTEAGFNAAEFGMKRTA